MALTQSGKREAARLVVGSVLSQPTCYLHVNHEHPRCDRIPMLSIRNKVHATPSLQRRQVWRRRKSPTAAKLTPKPHNWRRPSCERAQTLNWKQSRSRACHACLRECVSRNCFQASQSLQIWGPSMEIWQRPRCGCGGHGAPQSLSPAVGPTQDPKNLTYATIVKWEKA